MPAMIGSDLRFGARALARHPWSTAASISTLALGIGINASLFSIANYFLFRPLPVPQPGQIVTLVYTQNHGSLQSQFSYPNFEDIRSATPQRVAELIGYRIGLDGLSGGASATRVVASYVTDNYFSALHLVPVAGSFAEPDSQSFRDGPYVVLSYACWRTVFHRDPNIVGRHVEINGHPFDVLGVAPKGFYGLHALLPSEIFLPLRMSTIEGQSTEALTQRSDALLSVLARLGPGTSIQKLALHLSGLSMHLSEQYPGVDKNLLLKAMPESLTRLDPNSASGLVTVSAGLLVLGGIVLLLACLNVAMLLLVQLSARNHEFAVRAALGATRARIVRFILSEGLLLVVAGTSLGIGIAWVTCQLVRSINWHTDIPFSVAATVDSRVLLFSCLIMCVTCAAVGLYPALRTSSRSVSTDLSASVRTSSQKTPKLQIVIVALELAVSLAVLTVAMLFYQNLRVARGVSLGFDPSHVVNIGLDTHEVGYDEAHTLAFYDQLLDRIRAVPGVRAASLATAVPIGYNQSSARVARAGSEFEQTLASSVFNVVSTQYLEVMQISLLKGREFADADTTGSTPVALINQAMAKSLFGASDPIGQALRIEGMPKPVTVVGIVNNIRETNLIEQREPMFYLPLRQHYSAVTTLQIRSELLLPMGLTQSAASLIHGIEPKLPLLDVQTMRQALETLDGLLLFRWVADISGALGMVGLMIAVVGSYGVVAFTINQRKREVAIRVALGATKSDILWLIARHAVIIVGGGVTAGLGLAYFVVFLVERVSLLGRDTDFFAIVTLGVVLAISMIPAYYLPARRLLLSNPLSWLHES